MRVRRVAAITITGALLLTLVTGFGSYLIQASIGTSVLYGEEKYRLAPNADLMALVFVAVSSLTAFWFWVLAFLPDDGDGS